jgi:hypothetical protein
MIIIKNNNLLISNNLLIIFISSSNKSCLAISSFSLIVNREFIRQTRKRQEKKKIKPFTVDAMEVLIKYCTNSFPQVDQFI